MMILSFRARGAELFPLRRGPTAPLAQPAAHQRRGAAHGCT